MGYHPETDLAYIKPATQNESPQPVQLYCEVMGISCVPIGPIVFYRGFTRAFLAGETESTEALLAKVEETVDKLAQGKRVVIIDGVGFPAVGSICGTDNASVAMASGYPVVVVDDDGGGGRRHRKPPGVLLVGGSGVGGAVDAFNLNATYFERVNIPVMGALFNKLSLDGFYSLENCKQQVSSYFRQNPHQIQLGRQAFGFVPLVAGIKAGGDVAKNVEQFVRVFGDHVDIAGILESANKVQNQSFPMAMDTTFSNNGDNIQRQSTSSPPTKKLKGNNSSSSSSKVESRTRSEIESAAIQGGAAPSA
jgi:hypothetical protein